MGMIAALYVVSNGIYFGLPNVDPWDKGRDARLYAGPHPIVAHPPCERWGRYWGGAPSTWPRLKRGDDGGCFAAALAAPRRWGGVIEHPADTWAWRHFRLLVPPREGGWIRADWMEGHRGWTCCIEQAWYGHRARKRTWLYAHGTDLPELKWGPAPGNFVKLDQGFHSKEERMRAVRTGACQRLSAKERAPQIKGLLSYSDPSVGHEGTVYEADNWCPLGLTAERSDFGWRSRKGRKQQSNSQKMRWFRTP